MNLVPWVDCGTRAFGLRVIGDPRGVAAKPFCREALELAQKESGHSILVGVNIGCFSRPAPRTSLSEAPINEAFYTPLSWMFFHYDKVNRCSVQVVASSEGVKVERVGRNVDLERLPLVEWAIDCDEVLRIAEENRFTLPPIGNIGGISLHMQFVARRRRPIWETPFLTVEATQRELVRVYVAADHAEIFVPQVG